MKKETLLILNELLENKICNLEILLDELPRVFSMDGKQDIENDIVNTEDKIRNINNCINWLITLK